MQTGTVIAYSPIAEAGVIEAVDGERYCFLSTQ